MVKCSECGFLAVRNTKTRTLVEAEFDYRQTGEQPKAPLEYVSRKFYSDYPSCFVLAVQLKCEIGESCHSSKICQAIKLDRDCEKFTPWLQGFSPKEHKEMLHEKQLLEWKANREDADRVWQEKQTKKDQTWREGQSQKADRRFIIGLICAFLTGLIAAMISSG